jgi:hypothetical protein
MINAGTATPRLDLLGPILQEGFPEDAYVAHRVLPPLGVQKKTGAIPSFLFTNDQALRIRHSPKTAYAQVQSTLGQSIFNCGENGVEEPLSPEDYEILGRDRAEMTIARRLVHIVLRARDYALQQVTFSVAGESTFAANLVSGSSWASTNDPILMVLEAKMKVARSVGVPADSMLIGYADYIALCGNSYIQSKVRNVLGYSGERSNDAISGEIPIKVLAQTFGLKEIIVAGGVINSADEGQTASRDFIWDGYALVFKGSAGRADANEVCLGRMFTYELAEMIGSLAVGTTDMARSLMMEWYRREDISADMFRARDYLDMQFLVPTAASLIKSI